MSPDCRHFIEGMIEPNLNRRMTVNQALDHKWFKAKEEETHHIIWNQKRDEMMFRRIKELKRLKTL